MDSDAVPTSSTLFGADGTQLPDPLPAPADPLTGPEYGAWAGTSWSGTAWPDIAEIAPVPLPPMPDARAMQAAIAAVLADDPAARPAGPARNPPAPRMPVPPRPRTPAGPPRTGTTPPTGPRRRSGQESARQLQSRSSGGVRIGFIIALMIIGVVAFYLAVAVVQAVSALFS